QAWQKPRMPQYSVDESHELSELSAAQKFDVHASIVEMRGNEAARSALRNGDVVLLGLRQETSTIASMDQSGTRGTGVYDDHIVVLRKDADGERQWHIAGRASTEPTAQYDEHARPGPARDSIYANVRWRRSEGFDANGDGVVDLGRLVEGTIEMVRSDHPNPASARTNVAFRPSPEQLGVHSRVGLIERDTNADGQFDENDPS